MSNDLSFRLAFRTFTDAFRFSGRSTRTQIVAFSLLSMLANVVNIAGPDSPPFGLLAVVGIIWSMIWIWPSLPLFVRRLHDQGRSGWWAIIAVASYLGAALQFVLPAAEGPTSSASVHFGLWSHRVIWTPLNATIFVMSVVAALVTLILTFLPETPGDNRFGADPRLDVPDDLAASPAET